MGEPAIAMTDQPKLCQRCGGTLHIRRLAELTGSHGQYAARLRKFPVRTCSMNHEWWEVSADFLATMSEYLDYEAPLMTKRQGLVRRKHHCAKCGVIIQSERRVDVVLELTVPTKDGLDFDVELRGPGVRCYACGHEQLWNSPQEGGAAFLAIRAAVESHEIKLQ